MATHNIVVIGGSYSGIGIAQGILASIPETKVTLISTSENCYFNIAAPRILARPNSTALEKVIWPIKEHFFSKFPATKFEFIHATATSMDPVAKTVALSNSSTVTYDYLVIATGSTTEATNSGIPVKQPTDDSLNESIKTAQDTIAAASTIVIAGGGPVAVEMAGEIAEASPGKSVTLVSGSKRLLESLSKSVSAKALSQLKKLGVDVLLGVKTVQNSKEGAKTIISLDNGQSLTADLFIPAIGIIPNSSFIPSALLDDKKYLAITEEQRVPNAEGVYGLGDVTTRPIKMAAAIKSQIQPTLANLKNDIEKKGKREVWKAPPKVLCVPIGAKGGVAEVMGWSLPSFLVWLMKGNFFISVGTTVSGFKKQ